MNRQARKTRRPGHHPTRLVPRLVLYRLVLRLASSPNRRHRRAAHQASRLRRSSQRQSCSPRPSLLAYPPPVAIRMTATKQHASHLIAHALSPSLRGHHQSITTHAETDDHRPTPRRAATGYTKIGKHRNASRGSHSHARRHKTNRHAPQDEQNSPPTRKSRIASPDDDDGGDTDKTDDNERSIATRRHNERTNAPPPQDAPPRKRTPRDARTRRHTRRQARRRDNGDAKV